MLPLRDANPRSRFPITTVVFILLNIFIFGILFFSSDPYPLIQNYALTPANINFYNIASFGTFVTAIFLHGGLFHLLSNIWFIWIFGDNVEDRLGPILYVVLFLVGGTIGNLIQYITAPSSTIPIVGASGAVASILGSYIVMFPKNKIKTLIPILGFITIVNIPAYGMILYWFGLQLLNGFLTVATADTYSGGVAWFAHIGGFMAGYIITWIIHKKQN